jgi:prepilin-type N-terminal cleavage/methylation domain-containing protein
MKQKSFTLIELLVVIGIIALLSAIILPNYRVGEKEFALQRSASKLAQDLRRAQEMAMSAKEYPGAPETFRGGYGIYLNISEPYRYILFADLDNDQIFDSGETVETLELEKKVIISNLFPSSPLNVVFIPPDPQVFISGGNEGRITLALETDLTKTRFVIVNKAGLVYITGEEDQCDSTADCDDGNLCTNDWCERAGDSDSICHNDPLADGTDCGDCRECQSGVCTTLCQGTESSCECISDFCIDCSVYYGEECGYGACTSTEKPSWSCSGGSCVYSCYEDPVNCGGVCYGVPDNTQVPGCDGLCQACQSGSCGVANVDTDPGNDCSAADCYTGNCNGSGACGYYTDNQQHNCSTCYACDASGNCTARTVDGSSATALGCTEGDEECRRCNAGTCTYYTSDQHDCAEGYICNAAGVCEEEEVACGGTKWGGYCWYVGGVEVSCTTVCEAHGGNVGTCQENDNGSCALHEAMGVDCLSCWSTSLAAAPAMMQWGTTWICASRKAGSSGSCNATLYKHQRLCACQE